MTNFDWENIEKEAGRKKFYFSVFLLVIIAAGAFYYKYEINGKAGEAVISESFISKPVKKETAEIHTIVKPQHEFTYTVKIGRFRNVSAAKEFVAKNPGNSFLIYRENNEIYVNAGPVKILDEAQKMKENFILAGFPAIVEVYTPEILANEVKEEEIFPETVPSRQNLPDEFWTIQVAAYDELKSATYLKNQLRFSGIDSKIVQEGKYYKVHVGIFSSKSEAEEYSSKIDRKIVPGIYIRKGVK